MTITTKKPLSELFTDFRVANVTKHDGTTLLHLESISCPDTLAITVSIPTEVLDQHNLEEYTS